MSGRQRLIDGIAAVKILRVICPSAPWDVPLFCRLPIDTANTCAFSAAKLLERQRRHILTRKAHTVHLPHHTKTQPRITDQGGLPDQQAGLVRQRSAAGIITHTVFPSPENTDTRVPDELHGAVRHLERSLCTLIAAAGTKTVPRSSVTVMALS